MNKKFVQLAVCFVLGLGIQAGAYLYMDRVLFAPLSSGDYDMSDVKDKMAEAAEKEGKKLFAKVSVKGKAYYSHDYKYMADVTADTVTIYKADDLGNPQKVDLKNQGVSFFEWMPDRNLALMALYPAHWKGGRWDVTLARYNPDGTTHESDAPIRDLPRNSKIVDVAYSTATNAVYMKMEVGKGLYRIYRTDANYTFNGDDSSWRVISPPGAFRLVGVDEEKTIYAVKVNTKGEVTAYYTGKLGVGFKEVKALDAPVEFSSVTMHMIKEASLQSGNK